MKFGSVIEEARFRELQLLEHAGLIRDLEPHPPYVLFPESRDVFGNKLPTIIYTPDSHYVDCATKRRIVEDVKCRRYSKTGKAIHPTMTQAVRLRMAIFKHKYPNLELRLEYRETERRRR